MTSLFKKDLLQFWLFFSLTLSTATFLKATNPTYTKQIFWVLLSVQLIWGLAVYRKKNLNFTRISLALAALVIVQAGQYLTNIHSFENSRFLLSEIIYYFIFIALVEEIWFRGILQDSFASKPIKAILVSSIIFGLYHINSGVEIVIMTASIGFLYSIIRQFGTGILALSAVHGFTNWMNNSVFPPVSLKLDPSVFVLVFSGICIISALILLYFLMKENGEKNFFNFK